jgi:AcrR family transcriptional regulator
MPARPRQPRRKTAEKPESSSAAPTGKTGDRHESLVAAARDLIAERGFEGLRTREVAHRVGLNHATLHHYFPTKETLIEAVVRDLVQQLKTYRAAQHFADMPPGDALHAYFAAVPAQLRDDPGILIALQEFFSRARRNPALAKVVRGLDEGWTGGLASLLARGAASGAFRADLDPKTAAQVIVSFLRGVSLPVHDVAGLTRQLAQLEAWIVGPEKPKRPRRRP